MNIMNLIFKALYCCLISLVLFLSVNGFCSNLILDQKLRTTTKNLKQVSRKTILQNWPEEIKSKKEDKKREVKKREGKNREDKNREVKKREVKKREDKKREDKKREDDRTREEEKKEESDKNILIQSASPRLIIYLGKKCEFLQQLKKDIPLNIVSGSIEEIESKIILLDQSSSNRLMLVSSPLSYSFTKKVGYSTISLNGNYKTALKLLKMKIKNLPVTESDLPHVDPHEAGLFYDLMMKVDVILKSSDIPYWATCGSCLGVIRHQGIIPWDDDIDIALFYKDLSRFVTLEKEFANHGLEIAYHPEFEFYKIFPKNGQEILKKDGSVYPWKYPFVDVFFMEQYEGKFTYSGTFWREGYKDFDYYFANELKLPLPHLPFGPMLIPVSHQPLDYIKRMYGDDWNDVAYVTYSHKNEKNVQKVKVDLINRSPAKYILPEALDLNQ